MYSAPVPVDVAFTVPKEPVSTTSPVLRVAEVRVAGSSWTALVWCPGAAGEQGGRLRAMLPTPALPAAGGARRPLGQPAGSSPRGQQRGLARHHLVDVQAARAKGGHAHEGAQAEAGGHEELGAWREG